LEETMATLADAVAEGRILKLGIERVDGEPVLGSGVEEALIAAGFSRGPRKLVKSA
jgi:ATP-dependent Lhr-like helicase